MVKYIFAREISTMEEKIKRNNADIEEIHKKLTENVDALQKDFQGFKEKVAEDYLKKRDFNGMVSDITKKIDKIYDIILDMRGNIKNG
jgi:predicted  nucleic acid-binding Zn-ribbon protein